MTDRFLLFSSHLHKPDYILANDIFRDVRSHFYILFRMSISISMAFIWRSFIRMIHFVVCFLSQSSLFLSLLYLYSFFFLSFELDNEIRVMMLKTEFNCMFRVYLICNESISSWSSGEWFIHNSTEKRITKTKNTFIHI